MIRPSKTQLVRYCQKKLNELYGLDLEIDGRIGNQTISALSKVPAIPTTWKLPRRFVGFVQYLTHLEPEIEDIAVDGYWGGMTQNAYNELRELDKTGEVKLWRDEYDHFDEIRQTKSRYKRPYRQGIEQVYGKPGDMKNYGRVKVPYRLELSWDTSRTIGSFICHKKLIVPIQEAMEECLAHYGASGIKELKLNNWGGCYNYRRMRGGRRLSTHAYAVAIDFATLENPLRARKETALFSDPVYKEFFIAWQSAGFYGLGPWKDYDFQHIQAVKV